MEAAEQAMIRDEMSKTIIDTAEALAMEYGADCVNVRRILQTLGITNRVFYNRFHNITEVLDIVYENVIQRIRESITAKFDPDGDFFTQVIDIVSNPLVMSYEVKMNFNNYVFETDSITSKNYEWWKAQIRTYIEFGIDRGYLKALDTEAMSYAIWCFIRGYNADALGRRIPKEKALADFKYSFGVLLDGMKA
ncbi:MAG: TetR/AcrR family transcriptional regulator [Clostridia bacterium]|nr:TetR/AcrR family transcriptional regulator [Clostridia bacterium]